MLLRLIPSLIQPIPSRFGPKRKHLKYYSTFLGDQNIYGVIGIISPIGEMYPTFLLPLMVDAILLP